MDQTEIGKFIAKCRKEKKLSQAQLAGKLNITDRAVSKWETGKSMPDPSIMLELCGILDITVNELLRGEKLRAEGPGAEEFRAEGPGAEKPGAEEFRAEEFRAEGSSAEKPGAEKPGAEGAGAEKPGAEELRAEGSSAEKPGAEKPSAEKPGAERNEKKTGENLVVRKRRGEHKRANNVLLSILFSAALLIGIMVCLICDMAISKTLTWSPIPVSSIVFAWVILFPSILLGKRGLMASLLALSIFIVPYLFLLSRSVKVKEVFSIGSATAAASVVFLWIIAAVFDRAGKNGRSIAWGIVFLLAVPFLFLINFILSKLIAEPILDLWDILTVFILVILAFVFLVYGCAKKREAGPTRSTRCG